MTWRQAWKEKKIETAGRERERDEVRKHATRFMAKFHGNWEAAYEAARKRADRSPEHSFDRTRYNAIAEHIKGEIEWSRSRLPS